MTQDRIPLDAGSSRPAMEGETELLPCPFCGGKPRVDLAKKTFCQLHGEPSQAVRVYCYHDCPSRPSVEAGDTFNGGEAKARAVAIAAWNRRALPSAPTVEGVEPVAWRVREKASDGKWSFWRYIAEDTASHYASLSRTDIQVEPLYPASAISRLVKERDEARKEVDVVSAAIGSPRFMDPPDGGSVTLAEQVGRMRETLESAEASVARLTALLAEARRERDAIRNGIYTASKTAHADKWRALRASGVPVISTWIDEAGVGETADFSDLWLRCIGEASRAEAVLLFREPGEVLKGAFIEAGAALACGVPVHAIGCGEFSFVNHPLVTQHESVVSALAAIRNLKEPSDD